MIHKLHWICDTSPPCITSHLSSFRIQFFYPLFAFSLPPPWSSPSSSSFSLSTFVALVASLPHLGVGANKLGFQFHTHATTACCHPLSPPTNKAGNGRKQEWKKDKERKADIKPLVTEKGTIHMLFSQQVFFQDPTIFTLSFSPLSKS